MIGVIVVLMNRANITGKVHDSGARRKGKPDQPVVPTGAADNEFRDFLIIKTSRKNKIINPLRRTLAVGLKSKVSNCVFPAFSLKIQGRLNIRVPAAAREKKVLLDTGNRFDGAAEVAHKQDVAIDITEDIVNGDLFRLVKNAGEIL